MFLISCFLIIFLSFINNIFMINDLKNSTVLIAILIRNKAHILPYFLTLLEDLNYPKDRISLWIRTDNNIDNSVEILEKWLKTIENQYHSTDILVDHKRNNFNQNGPAHWTDERFIHIIKLRESAIKTANKIWADYILFLDSDVLLTNPNTLSDLISNKHIISSPMLKSDGLYSNFWAGMSQNYYYERAENYEWIVNRKNISCFQVPMVHSCVLIDLRYKITEKLTYNSSKLINYSGPNDDIIVFAISANQSNVPLYVCNNRTYGYISIPLEQNDDLNYDKIHLTNLKLEILNNYAYLEVKDIFKDDISSPEKDTLDFDKIFMINLLRRPERRKRMMKCFDELGLNVTVIDAVDGKLLNDTVIKQWGIKFLPEFQDPFHKRPMKMGEIGCFLSHHKIWKEMVANNYQIVMVLEDDIRFEPFFRFNIIKLMNDLNKINDWNLVYLGRKRLLQDADEPWVTNTLVKVGYSYWTLGYILNLDGAKKLLEAKPLNNMVPVDEYLPILFDRHPRDNWKGYFPHRDLVAYSAAPLLIYPTHYIGEHGYISDTENSTQISNNLVEKEFSVYHDEF